MNYYSPELVGYIQDTGTAAHQLTQKADIFALGLIYAEYLTGALPAFDAARYQYAGVAARTGEILRLPPTTLPTSVVELVDRMLLADPGARPTIAEVHTALLGIRTAATTTAVLTAAPPQADPDRPEPAQGPGAADGDPGNAIPRRRAEARPAAHRQAPGPRQRPGHAMSTRWQCAVCEASNDGGDTCSVCGATVVKTTTRVPPAPKPPARKPPVQEQDDTSVPVRELPVREPARDVAYPAGFDIYDYFMVEDPAVARDRYAELERYEARPRVRVYGCCLPITLGLLLALISAVMVLANLVGGAL